MARRTLADRARLRCTDAQRERDRGQAAPATVDLCTSAHEAGYLPNSAIMGIQGWSSMAMLTRYLGRSLWAAQLKRYPTTLEGIFGRASMAVGPTLVAEMRGKRELSSSFGRRCC